MTTATHMLDMSRVENPPALFQRHGVAFVLLTKAPRIPGRLDFDVVETPDIAPLIQEMRRANPDRHPAWPAGINAADIPAGAELVALPVPWECQP